MCLHLNSNCKSYKRSKVSLVEDPKSTLNHDVIKVMDILSEYVLIVQDFRVFVLGEVEVLAPPTLY